MRAVSYGLVITVLVALLNGANAQISLTYSPSSPNGGLFGEVDLSAGDNNSGGGAASNGYLPPIGSEPSSNVPAFAKPPAPEDSGREDLGEPTNPQPQFTVPAPQPQLGCAAAMLCVEEQFCTMLGIISESPVSLTEDQKLRSVPMVDCKNPDNGVIGKCCRDPNYVDPWPAGNLPANYSGGFDEQGFPSFLNLSKTKPKKPVKVVQSVQTPHNPILPQQSSFQPLRPQSVPEPAKVIPQSPVPFQKVNPFLPNNLQPQPSFQTTKVIGIQTPQVVQPVQHIPQTPVNQVVEVVQHHQPQQTFQHVPQQQGIQHHPTATFQHVTQTPVQQVIQHQPQPTATFQHVTQAPVQQVVQHHQPQTPAFQHISQTPVKQVVPQHQTSTFQHIPQTPVKQVIQQHQTSAFQHIPQTPVKQVVQQHQTSAFQHIPQTPVKQVVQQQKPQTQTFQQQTFQTQPFQPAPFSTQQQQHHPQTIHVNQPVKISQPAKTFAGLPSLPNFPAFQDIPNQISQQINNLNPFNRPIVVEDTETVNGPADVPEVSFVSTTNKPGFFQDFPKPSFSIPSLPSFPGFTKGQSISSTAVSANPPVIEAHTPGAQCGIVNKVQHNGGLGDVDVAFGEIPWQAMILSNTEKKLLCSGVIIAPNLVMTAAHCVYGLTPNTVSVKAGEWKLGYELNHEEPLKFEIVAVSKIVAHPNYQPGEPGFDTAMLFLEHPFKLDLHVDTICVGQTPVSTIAQQQRKCISTGWGKTILEVHAAGALMHKIDVDVMSGDQCRTRIQGAESPIDIDDSLLCVKAHRQNNNMCQVDVGGPLACDRGDGHYELVGVYSQDTGCLPTNQVATFATVDTKWVNAMLDQGSSGYTQPQVEYGSYPAPNQQSSKIHYHEPGVPCDCQQGTQPSGANQYLPPV